jgi:hypothetical protein
VIANFTDDGRWIFLKKRTPPVVAQLLIRDLRKAKGEDCVNKEGQDEDRVRVIRTGNVRTEPIPANMITGNRAPWVGRDFISWIPGNGPFLDRTHAWFGVAIHP